MRIPVIRTEKTGRNVGYIVANNTVFIEILLHFDIVFLL